MPGDRRTGVAVIGLGGAVATTAVAGVEQLKLGTIGTAGLPLAHRRDLVPYDSLVFGGWDLNADDLAKAAHVHRVIEPAQIEAVAGPLQRIEPWPAVADPAYCRNATGANVVPVGPLRERIARIREDLVRFRREQRLDTVVVVNLASTEAWPDLTSPILADLDTFEKGLDLDDPAITPGMLYAYAAIVEGCPVRQLHAEPRSRRAGPAEPGRAGERAGGRQGRQDRPDADQDGAGARVPLPRAERRRLVLDQHPRQPRRPDPRRPVVAGQQAGHQGLRARLDPRLRRRGPHRAHRLLPPARRRQGGLGQHRPGRLPRPADAAQGRLPVPGLDPGRAAGARARAAGRPRPSAAARAGRRSSWATSSRRPITRDGRVPEHALHVQERALLDWLDVRG